MRVADHERSRQVVRERERERESERERERDRQRGTERESSRPVVEPYPVLPPGLLHQTGERKSDPDGYL